MRAQGLLRLEQEQLTACVATVEIRDGSTEVVTLAVGHRRTTGRRPAFDAARYRPRTSALTIRGSWSTASCAGALAWTADMVFFDPRARPASGFARPGSAVAWSSRSCRTTISRRSSPRRLWSASVGGCSHRQFKSDRVASIPSGRAATESGAVGNVFLAGDAAHQAPPLFGQGLCAGIRDAPNLTWKLRYVLRGLADDFALDTYESERRTSRPLLGEEQPPTWRTSCRRSTPSGRPTRRAHPEQTRKASAIPRVTSVGTGAACGDPVTRPPGFSATQPILDDGTPSRRCRRLPLPPCLLTTGN